MACTAGPESIAISHCIQSHRRPDHSESPNRKLSLRYVERHADISHNRPTSQDFRGSFGGMSCEVRSTQGALVSLAKNFLRIARASGVCDSIASHTAVASRDSGHQAPGSKRSTI